MKPIATGYSVKAICPQCRAITLFDVRDQSREFGHTSIDWNHKFSGKFFLRLHWRLLRCSGCGQGGLAKFHDSGNSNDATLESFHPRALNSANLPSGVPAGIANEYREAELCASVEAWRGASALLRSTLEKTLKENGYIKGSLYNKIDEAAADGVITAARQRKAHDDIRTLGNDVVHEDWREVDEDEVMSALHYAQRIIEDLYDDRPSVEALLRSKGRIK